MVKVLKPLTAYCHVQILKSCKFGKNPLTYCKDNVYLSIFGLNLAASFSNVTLKMRFVMYMYKIHANLGKIS